MPSSATSRATRRRAARRTPRIRTGKRSSRTGKKGLGRVVRLVIRVVARARVEVRRLIWDLLGALRAVGARIVKVRRGVLEVVVAVAATVGELQSAGKSSTTG